MLGYPRLRVGAVPGPHATYSTVYPTLALGTPRLTTQNDPPMCKRPPVDRLSILPPLSARARPRALR